MNRIRTGVKAPVCFTAQGDYMIRDSKRLQYLMDKPVAEMSSSEMDEGLDLMMAAVDEELEFFKKKVLRRSAAREKTLRRMMVC